MSSPNTTQTSVGNESRHPGDEELGEAAASVASNTSIELPAIRSGFTGDTTSSPSEGQAPVFSEGEGFASDYGEMEDTSVTPVSSAITEVVIPAPRAGADSSKSETIQKSKMSLEGFTDTEPVPMLGDWNPTAAGEDGPTRIVHPGVPSTQDSLPRFIGPYRVLDRIGQGGMGEVFRALSLEANRIVAIKCMHAGASEESKERFAREIRFLHKVDHPNVCAVYDSGVTEEGTPYFVMKYIEGVLLETLLNVSPPPLWKVTEFCGQIASGLSASHAQGIAHRDLKPRNVIIAADSGVPVVVDFGIALEMDPEEPRLTQVGSAVGTPSYMAPEQIRGDGPVSGILMDVWGVGIILFESISGKAPFSGRTDLEIMDNVLHKELPDLLDRGGFRVDSQLEALVKRCLSKDPEARFQNMEELAQSLKVLTDRRIEALPFRSPEENGKTITLDLNAPSAAENGDSNEPESYAGRPVREESHSSFAWKGALLWTLLGTLLGIAVGFWLAT